MRDQDLLRALMDTLPDAIYFKDLQSRFVRINPALAAWYGLADPAQAVGRSDFDFFPAELARRFLAQEREILRTGRPLVDLVERQALPGGGERWVSTTKLPLRDVDGIVVGTFGLSRDVTAHERAAAEVRRLNAELERRVRERTAQAEAALRDLWGRVREQEQAEAALRESEARYRVLVEELPAITYRTLATPPYADTFISPQVEALLGVSPAEWLARPDAWAERVHPEDRERVLDRTAAMLAAGGDRFADEYRLVARDGRAVWVRDETTIVRDASGHPAYLHGMMLDVTARKRAEEALRTSEARLRAIAESLLEAVYEADLTRPHRPSGVLLYYSANVERVMGYPLADWYADDALFVKGLHPDDRERVLAEHDHLLAQGETMEIEYRWVKPDGSVVWIEDRARVERDAAGRPLLLRGTNADVTERKRLEEQLEQQALQDALTGLPNRRLLQDRLEQALLAARRDGQRVALLLMDLDRFKEVNDALGHQAGDLLLEQVGQRLRDGLRGSDTAARLGGDEFAVLLPRIDAIGAALAAERLLEALAEPVVLAGQALVTEASIGIALFPEHGEDPETLLRHADAAMYRAKKSGGGYLLYTGKYDQASLRQLALLAELRAALEQRSLTLHYQPLVRCRGGEPVGVEALARWPHPERGMVPPAEFIPLAEQTGLIQPLTRWVLTTALQQLGAWWRAGVELTVAVNLSPRNLHDPGLPGLLAEALAAAGAPADRLRLEITEGAVMADPDRAQQVLAGLRALGVALSLDDFGTGYSSLARLKHLPVDELKIDRAFVTDMASDEDDAAIVRAAIDLGHTLGMHVVAEGVEDAATLRLLVGLGCDVAQGYHISRPLPAPELEAWLAARPQPKRVRPKGRPPRATRRPRRATGPARDAPIPPL